MNMQWMDWMILVAFLVVLTALGLRTRRYMKGVADFLAANRCADRYLLTIAAGSVIGTISVIAICEQLYTAGLAQGWWSSLSLPVGLLITLTGFGYYRFRETRCLTLAQFFEVRYSRRFRVFSGLLIFSSGILNYGIFPAVSARFFVYYCGFPQEFQVWGVSIPTFAPIMAILLALALMFTFMGGMITILVTDFAQGQFMNVALFIIMCTLVYMFPWSRIGEALINTPAHHSLVNPFDTSQVKDFNIWYYLIGILGSIYGVMAWQGASGFNAAATTPHEGKMGNVLGIWRSTAVFMALTLMPICAYTYMHHPAYADRAAVVAQKLAQIENPQIRTQMTVPLALADFLPHGIMGLLCTVMVAMFITTDDTYMHSWGSIFIQDVILPFRKEPFTPQQHVRLLRYSILGVAVFGFFFSLWFRQTDFILMFFAITGAIWCGGAGSAIIGGLYWKRGTTAAAYAAVITGSTLAIGNIVLQQVWDRNLMPRVLSWLWAICPGLNHFRDLSIILKGLPAKCPINGQVGLLISMIGSIALYVVISLLHRHTFDLDRMLHRDEATPSKPMPETVRSPRRKGLLERIGIGGPEFTRGDKILYVITSAWSIFWFLVFIILSLYNLLVDVKPQWWLKYHHGTVIYIPFIVSVVTTPIFFVYGIRDAVRLFRRLDTGPRSALDDGMVVNPHTLDEESSLQTREYSEVPVQQ